MSREPYHLDPPAAVGYLALRVQPPGCCWDPGSGIGPGSRRCGGESGRRSRVDTPSEHYHLDNAPLAAPAHGPGCEGFRDDRGRAEGICQSWCWSHCKCEPLQEGDYRICGECFHVFPTGEALVEDTRTMLRQIQSDRAEAPLDPETIWSCPLCAHDF